LKASPGCRSVAYDKPGDVDTLQEIKKVCDKRPTYGYLRVTAVLKREKKAKKQAAINHKRVYRIMKNAGLILPKSGVRTEKVHEGKIITLHSNTRWCSDSFEFRCFNREKIFVAFIEDTCDREAISWFASTAPITSEVIRDLAAVALERRFGNGGKPPHPVEFLSDNGGCYRAEETKRFLKDQGFIPCYTPSYSPESNGMSESLVKTVKRDYVRVSEGLETAQDAIKEVSEWFRDYNANHPHSGLRMMSPAEFRMANSTN